MRAVSRPLDGNRVRVLQRPMIELERVDRARRVLGWSMGGIYCVGLGIYCFERHQQTGRELLLFH
jgi:hypothetical protein